MKFKKKPSPLKLLSQSQLNFAETQMGNQIYFKIAGKKKKLIAGSNRQTHFWKRTIQ
jgi:hypothetical protein